MSKTEGKCFLCKKCTSNSVKVTIKAWYRGSEEESVYYCGSKCLEYTLRFAHILSDDLIKQAIRIVKAIKTPQEKCRLNLLKQAKKYLDWI